MLPTVRRGPRRLAMVSALAMFTVVTGAPEAMAQDTFPVQINLPDGFQPEGITTGRGATVYVGSLANGAIWRGNVKTGQGSIFAEGASDRVAVGLDYEKRSDRIWVAGGATDSVSVYDAPTGTKLKRYDIGGAGFLNDLVVTKKAVYVTDSQVQRLVVIPLGRHGGLPPVSEVVALPLTGTLAFVPGQFNNNGIVASKDGRKLIVVNSASKQLFTVNPTTGAARVIPLTGGALDSGDGLTLRGRTLYVTRGAPNAVVVVQLSRRFETGHVLRTLTADPPLDVPSTGTIAAGSFYVVNARFGPPPTPTTKYWITRLGL